MNAKDFNAIVMIEEFPSRPEIMKLLNEYFNNNNITPQYSCDNKANVLVISFSDSDIAYGFLKQLHNEQVNNALYKKCLCSLSFKRKGMHINHSNSLHKLIGSRSYSTTTIDDKSSHTLSTKQSIQSNRIKRFGSLHKNIQSSSYQHSHWKNIRTKAGIITTDSPYMPDNEYVKLKNRENRKKWICQSNFNLYVGKASSNKAHVIKNYVGMTPSEPPVLYNFRTVHKKKWLNEKGFLLC